MNDREKKQKIIFVETGKVELTFQVPNLLPENAKVVIREVRHGLENCGRLDLLNEFTETLMVEYREEAN